MREVDYVKLSEQYGGFLIAIGGVSITVLSIVSTLGSIDDSKKQAAELALLINRSSFLSAALIVSTVCCFIGAHMMAETAAFLTHFKDKLSKSSKGDVGRWEPSEAITFGTRLFLIASTTIFIAVILVLFSIVLLPAVSRGNTNSSPIYSIIFISVGLGTLIWMVLASRFRMPVAKSWLALLIAIAVGGAWLIFLSQQSLTNGRLLVLTFLPIVTATVLSFINFAWIFRDSNKAYKRYRRKSGYKRRTPEISFYDVCFFSSAVTVSYVSLVVAGMKLEALTLTFANN